MQTPWERSPEPASVLSVFCSPAPTVCTLCSWGVHRKVCGELHLKLNECLRPIAIKYNEGEMQGTLKRSFELPEIARKELSWTSFAC